MRRTPKRQKKPKNPNKQLYMCYGLFIFMAARILLPYDDFFADKLPLVYAVALVLGILTVWLIYMRDAGKFSRKKRLPSESESTQAK